MAYQRLGGVDEAVQGALVELVPGISVIVPCYRSPGTLPELVDRVERTVAALAGEDYEVVLVDDGSTDGTWHTIAGLTDERPRVRGISLLRNYGQHNATLCGVRAARFATVVTLDDDLQQPPEEIARLVEALMPEVDVVYGVPVERPHGLFRNVSSAVTKFSLEVALGADVGRLVGSFRAFRTQLRDAFVEFNAPYVSLDVLLSWATTRVAGVKVPHNPRAAGRSNYGPRALIVHAINMITGFSNVPLQLSILVGFTFGMFGMAILAYVLIHYVIYGGAVPGFTFLAALIAILSGAQLFALGVVGEYIGRIYSRSLDHPSYAVRRETRGGEGVHSTGARV